MNESNMTPYDAAKLAVKIGSEYLKLGNGLKGIFINPSELPNYKLKALFNYDYWLIYFNQDWVSYSEVYEVLHTGFHEVRHAYQAMQVLYKDKGLIHYYHEDDNRIRLWKEELDEYYLSNDNTYKYHQDIEIDAIAFAHYMMKKLYLKEFLISKLIKAKVDLRIKEIDEKMRLK